MKTYRIIHRNGERRETTNKAIAIRNARRADALRVEMLVFGRFHSVVWASRFGGAK